MIMLLNTIENCVLLSFSALFTFLLSCEHNEEVGRFSVRSTEFSRKEALHIFMSDYEDIDLSFWQYCPDFCKPADNTTDDQVNKVSLSLKLNLK